jgi:HTH-type transcriptional repressor of NAD biosynthesis genes
MSPRFGTGLVVGKFCPLHRGHQHVIDTAIAACARVVVVSYTKPEFPRCGPVVRERWLRQLHPMVVPVVFDDASLRERCRALGIGSRIAPENAAPEAAHSEFIAWLLREVVGTGIDAVFGSEDYGEAFAASLAARFGHVVQSVCVDSARVVVPVSGTQVRADPFAHRTLLDPRVYADLVARVAILGGESSGKTTLAQALAKRLDTVWAPEYGRELWVQRAGQLHPGDFLGIARSQVVREQQLAVDARGVLLCDTTPLTTLFYAQDAGGVVDAALEALAAREYDHVVVCAPDFDFVQDGTRRGAEFRARQHAWYLRTLADRGVAFTLVAGRLEARVDAMAGLLG